MSGHSKWHNIQKTKGAADAKRSQIFTKIAREMIVAVKTGGSGDPNNNSRLATVIAKAKAANMPNDNIKRTIDKALGSGNADSYENVVYEGYGPSGVAVIVDAPSAFDLKFIVKCAMLTSVSAYDNRIYYDAILP